MKHTQKALLLAVFTFLPFFCFAQDASEGLSIDTLSLIILVFNIVVWVTCAISIKQFIWHGEHNRSPFHVFNMVFVIIFHWVSLSFLISHKSYFEGYQQLSDIDCLKKYFLSFDLNSLLKRVIEVGFICNILYLIRYGRHYHINSNT